MFFDRDYDAETSTIGTVTGGDFVPVVLSNDLTTSRGRFNSRVEAFKQDGKAFPRTRHHGHWLLHNLVVHPLIAVFPVTFLLELHGLSSRWLNFRTEYRYDRQKSFVLTSPKVPTPKSRFFWVIHNLVSHVLIGLFPLRPFFFFHDWSAKRMGTPNWF